MFRSKQSRDHVSQRRPVEFRGTLFLLYPHAQPCSHAENISAAAPTWRDEEGSPQLLISGHVSDLSGHVDESTGHRGHSPKVKDPEEEKEHILMFKMEGWKSGRNQVSGKPLEQTFVPL